MKKLLPLAACIILGASSLASAQGPEAFKYQASIRNNHGEIIADKLVSIRVVILSNDKAVYSETHTVSTNKLGLVNFEIGRGKSAEGTFSAINWDASKHFVRIEMDEQGGSNFKELGTSELLSVPYSIHAKMASDVMPGSITIQNEIAARQSADRDLQSQINIVRGMIQSGTKGNSETTLGIPQDLEALRNRFMADSVAVRGLISSASSSASSAVLTEKNRAEGVEAGLRTDVDAATATNNAQATAITNNTNAIAAETARAQAAEAALDAKIGTSGGSGIRRMTTAQRDSLSVQGGEMIYNTSVNKFQGYQAIEATPYLDQDHFIRWSTIGLNLYSGNTVAQSFTPAVTDSLKALTLSIYYADGNQDYVLKVYQGEGTNGNMISQQNITIPNMNNYYSSNNNITVTLGQGVALTAGNVYTFELSGSDNNYRYFVMWFTSEYAGYNYTGGMMYMNGSPYNYYYYYNNNSNTTDMLFKTHMKGADALGWTNMR
jgi:hypothetical protein